MSTSPAQWANRQNSGINRKESGESLRAPPGWVEFEKRLEQLRTTFELTCDIEECLPNALKNKYKNREVLGNLLHFVIDYDAMDNTSCEVMGENVGLVLEYGARVDAWMVFTAFGQEGKVAPIHLAATRGLIPAVKLLVEYAADVNQKSMHAGELHFCPIHDAAFHQNFEAVDCLLQLHANPNMSNKDGKYPLHIVAENGGDEVAELLIQAKARLDVELPTNQSSAASTSPFHLAIQRRFFPKERLHLLAPFCYPDYEVNFFNCMVEVCKENIPAAKALVASILVGESGGHPSATHVDHKKRDMVVKAVKQGCSKGVSPIPSLTEIIKLAPDVACAILDIFLVTPKATSPAHALPRVANLADGFLIRDTKFFSTPVPMFTTFDADVEWKFQSNIADRSKQFPAWHDKLVPRARSNEDDCEVQVKYLSFPNILDVRVLHALNSTRNKKVFGSLTIQAVTRCSWQCVEKVAWIHIALEFVIIVIHSWWAMVTLELVPIEPMFQDKNPVLELLNRLLAFVPVQNATLLPPVEPSAARTFHHKLAVSAMSVLWASAFRETFLCICHVVEHRAWRFTWSSFFNAYNMMELLSTFMLGNFLVLFGLRGVNSFTNLLFCVNILIRAVKLLIKLCLTQPVGKEILPIIVSFAPMGRFFFFASMIYFTFLVAFSTLRGSYSMHHVMTLLFFATWAGDGDSFVGLRQLDKGGNLSLVLLGLAVIAFTVCTLNLMIAIFSKVYKDNTTEGTRLFLKHRCSACERVLLELTWKSECRRLRERPTDEEEHDDGEENSSQGVHRRDWLPYILSLVLFVVWLIANAVGSPGPFAIWLAAFLATSMVLLQAGHMQNTWFNREYHRQRLQDGLASSPSRLVNGRSTWMQSNSRDVQIRGQAQEYNRALTTESPDHRMAEYLAKYEEDFFIWICHRADFDGQQFGSSRDELKDMMLKLNNNVQKLDARLTEMDISMQQLEQRVCGGVTRRRNSGIKTHDKASVGNAQPVVHMASAGGLSHGLAVVQQTSTGTVNRTRAFKSK